MPQDKRQFRNTYIEFQIFKGATRDVLIKKYEIKGSLPDQIEQSIQLLQQNIWSVPKIQGVKREDVPAYQDIVLREVIANSLVHIVITGECTNLSKSRCLIIELRLKTQKG